MRANKSERVNIRITTKLLAAVDKVAAIEGRTRSEMLRELLREGLEAHGVTKIGLIDSDEQGS